MRSFILSVFLLSLVSWPAFSKPLQKAPAVKPSIKLTKKDKLNLILQVYASAQDRWSLYRVFKKKLPKKDQQYILSKTKQKNIKLKQKTNMKFLRAKRAFKIGKNPNLIYVSKNGKALRYKGEVFRYKGGARQTFEDVYSRLKKRKVGFWSLVFPQAFADSYDSSPYTASLDIMTLLCYLEVEWNGDTDFYSVLLHLADTEPEIYYAIERLFKTNGQKRIKRISCDNEYRMDLFFEDGSSSVINWNGVRGSGARAELTDRTARGSWNPVQLYAEDDYHLLNGKFFFCQMMGGENTAKSNAIISALNEMIAPQEYIMDESDWDPVDGSYEDGAGAGYVD